MTCRFPQCAGSLYSSDTCVIIEYYQTDDQVSIEKVDFDRRDDFC
jgi:hypothetical protein